MKQTQAMFKEMGETGQLVFTMITVMFIIVMIDFLKQIRARIKDERNLDERNLDELIKEELAKTCLTTINRSVSMDLSLEEDTGPTSSQFNLTQLAEEEHLPSLEWDEEYDQGQQDSWGEEPHTTDVSTQLPLGTASPNFKHALHINLQSFCDFLNTVDSLTSGCSDDGNESFTSWQKSMCHLNLGNLMDVQERHITNRKCSGSGVLASLEIRVCYPLPALTGEVGSELDPPSSEGT
ncbi:hypothetical protein J6590_033438 [Homalodisca vitripennis]|nr:hypothetical protein J6590_033438 [Homalodisca vitripennis]